METSFGSRVASSRWPSVVHAMLTGPLLSDGCVGVAASASRRRRRGEFYFCDLAGWVTGAAARYSLAWLAGSIRGSAAVTSGPSGASRRAKVGLARGRMSYLAGFISGRKWLKTRPVDVRTLRRRPSAALGAVLAATGGRSQHRRPRYRHAIIARLGGRVHRAVRSCDCQDRVSSSARGETHLAAGQGTS